MTDGAVASASRAAVAIGVVRCCFVNVVVPIALIWLAVRHLDKSVEVENIPKPVYPPEAMAEGRPGVVLVQYVVDESGRVDPSTLQVLYSDGDEFMREGVIALLKGKFKPAQAGGCAARELVQQRIQFKIGR